MTSNLGEIPIEQHRNKFLGLANKTYFNFGGQGILPKSALDAIISTHQYIQEVGPFSGKINTWLQEKTALTRQIIAEELGTTPNTITLTENVTAGCNIALWGIDWQPGDSILMTDCEHPGVIAAVGEISRRFGVTVEICPILSTLNQGDPVAIIEQSLTPRTRLLVMSHLLWNTGQILPLKEIVDLCHNYPTDNHPIQVLVDAAQSVGSLPLNLPASGIDYYAFTGHKWLCGPAGVGGLYISENAFATLHPTFIGWRGIEIDSDGQPQNWKNNGKKFEIATSAYPEYTGLREAIAIHRQWGDAQQRYQRICQLSNYLWSSLQNISGVECLTTSPPEAGIVSFKVSGNSYSMVKNLEQQGFFLRTIAKPDCIRACVHYLTLTEEIDGLVQLLSKSTY
ncbi:MAG: aminotransferase class V-fold PLP-dependent enzyme [Xenococcaceae cyanobacterium MO_207.B15]|nr:aminotransferase class V-fold PLP-dependent enzyme [Xenococcaceae cyanobacterium MO_207.B15]